MEEFVTAKVFGVILLERFLTEKDQRTRANQIGFKPGRGCTNQMHNLHWTLEQRWGFQKPTVMCVADCELPFDSADSDEH